MKIFLYSIPIIVMSFFVSVEAQFKRTQRSSETEILFPNQTETNLVYRCDEDIVRVSYHSSKNKSDIFKYFSIGKNKLNAEQMQNINNFIDNMNIEKLHLISCPAGQKDKKSIGFLLETSIFTKKDAKKIIVFSVGRNGEVSSAKLDTKYGESGELF